MDDGLAFAFHTLGFAITLLAAAIFFWLRFHADASYFFRCFRFDGLSSFSIASALHIAIDYL